MKVKYKSSLARSMPHHASQEALAKIFERIVCSNMFYTFGEHRTSLVWTL